MLGILVNSKGVFHPIFLLFNSLFCRDSLKSSQHTTNVQKPPWWKICKRTFEQHRRVRMAHHYAIFLCSLDVSRANTRRVRLALPSAANRQIADEIGSKLCNKPASQTWSCFFLPKCFPIIFPLHLLTAHWEKVAKPKFPRFNSDRVQSTNAIQAIIWFTSYSYLLRKQYLLRFYIMYIS